MKCLGKIRGSLIVEAAEDFLERSVLRSSWVHQFRELPGSISFMEQDRVIITMRTMF